MKCIKICVFSFVVFLISLSADAQNCDPWIVSIYKQLYNRQPSSEECNIKNYNNGSWSGYEQLTGYVKKYQDDKKPKMSQAQTTAKVSGDPWIKEIYKNKYNRQPNSWEYNIRNYNNGSWASYDELSKYIIEFQQSLKNQNISIETALLDETINLVVFKKEGTTVGINLLSNNDGKVLAAGSVEVAAKSGGKVVAAGGGNAVASGGGNVVAAGGGNAVASGGANAVASGGGNFQIGMGIMGAKYVEPRAVLSAGTQRIKTSGAGAFIFK